MTDPHDDDRRIDTLRLAVPDRGVTGRATLLVEDALRTASLPPANGRVVLIRKVDLGSIDLRRSSTALADRLREQVLAAWSAAVRGDRPGTEHAASAWFPSVEAAHAALLLRLLRHEEVPAWPWRAAVPLAWPSAGAPEVLRVLSSLRRAVLQERATRAVAEVVDDVVRAGALEALLDAVEPEDWAWIVPEAAGWDAAAEGAVAPEPYAAADADARSDTAAAPWISSVGDAWQAGRLSTEAARALALLAIARVGAVRAESTAGRARAAAVHRRWLKHVVLPREAIGLTAAAPRTVRGGIVFDSPAEERPAEVPPRAIRRAEVAATGAPPTAEPEPEASPAEAVRDASRTQAAGLLFLLRALDRLGLPAWLEADPRRADAWAGLGVLRAVLRRTGAPDRDAMRPLIASPADAWPFPDTWTAPDVWAGLTDDAPVVPRFDPLFRRSARMRGGLVEAQVAQHDGPAEDGPVPAWDDAWVDAVEAWLARYAEIDLAALVLRPGRVMVTRTHVDVLLAPEQADVRVRRAGLDLNPGWVAWWGRIVTFHYAARPP